MKKRLEKNTKERKKLQWNKDRKKYQWKKIKKEILLGRKNITRT